MIRTLDVEATQESDNTLDGTSSYQTPAARKRSRSTSSLSSGASSSGKKSKKTKHKPKMKAKVKTKTKTKPKPKKTKQVLTLQPLQGDLLIMNHRRRRSDATHAVQY